MMRAREPLVDEIDFIIHSLSMAMQRLALIRGKPFALFGHGYGAVLAYELGRGLHARFRRAPLRLLVAGSRAPPHVRFQERVSALAPPELLAHLRALGPAGVPEVILGRPELLDRVKPVLLADQRALESYHHDPNGILPCPVLVLDATGDDIPEEEIRDWELVTDEPVTLREFEGGHFFIQETPGVVLKTIKEVLEEDLENFQRGLQSASLIKKNRYLT
uniref:Thioesterase domain-containing protein n=1 Tax=Heterosigma akashiwo TaxID=2829 RepID=A0A7S3UUT5_HETAK